MILPVWMIVVAPLLAAVLAGAVALVRPRSYLAPGFSIVGILIAGHAWFWPLASANGPVSRHSEVTWLSIPPAFQISLGVHVDSLGWVMIGVVFVVSLLVQVYSLGYMKGEGGFARYFAYLSLFTASMLGLVTADNLFQLYVCWELVGICSYFLIGFWWNKPSAASAAKKAFVVTRFGDVGFLLGVLMLSSAAGSFRFDQATMAVGHVVSGDVVPALVSKQTFLWLVPVLLFCGAVGKSAQFPLHVWLPDAMEGPTPVSALIHAATMVAAGVYMVARLFSIFAMSRVAMDVVLLVGLITAFMAATIALVQVDIKKVMAYSTISQLGYMMMGLGAFGQSAGMFHLTTHAMFKALLFLCAGSVIHAMHDAQDPNDLRAMGGLFKRMPVTAWTCLIGVLALAGIWPFSGFWSKDAILGAAAHSESAFSQLALYLGIVIAGITAFYAVRMWMMAFAGAPRSEAAQQAHESPAAMKWPLIILAVPSVGLGLVLRNGVFERFLAGGAAVKSEEAGLPIMLMALLAASVGAVFAWKCYADAKVLDPVRRLPQPIYRALTGLWGMDSFWNALGARATLAAGRSIAWIDRNIVDRYVANGPGWLCGRAGASLRKTANGQAQSYVGAFVTGIAAVAALLVLYQSVVMQGSTANPAAGTGPAAARGARARAPR